MATEELERIVIYYPLETALNCVRKSLEIKHARAQAKHDLRSNEFIFMAAAASLMLIVTNYAVWSQSESLQIVLFADFTFAVLGLVGLLTGRAGRFVPKFEKLHPLPDDPVKHWFPLALYITVLGPFGIGLWFGHLKRIIQNDPELVVGWPNGRDCGNSIRVRASAVLADSRTQSLFINLLKAIEVWNQNVAGINGIPVLAAHTRRELTDNEAAVMADARKQRAEILRLITLADRLLKDGPVGTVIQTDAAASPLELIEEQMTALKDCTDGLEENALRMVAARETNRAGRA